MVFFLEKAPQEIKSVVDFLNMQMERAEVLLVEARQYAHNNLRIVIPTLFGYTDQARQIKKSITITGGRRRHWDSTSFFHDAYLKLDINSYNSIRKLYNECNGLSAGISWGSGKTAGSFKVSLLPVKPKTVFCLFRWKN